MIKESEKIYEVNNVHCPYCEKTITAETMKNEGDKLVGMICEHCGKNLRAFIFKGLLASETFQNKLLVLGAGELETLKKVEIK